ncbi:MAG: hypothetical protein IH606_06280 [Burkholderiales bacterium]|nr:hypothetical protein [Burkholderiales bacterium]
MPARVDAAEAAAKAASSGEARKAKYDHLRQCRARLADSNTKAEALTAKLQSAFSDLGPLLAELQLVIETRSANARAIVAGCGEHDENISRLVRFDSGEITEAFANLVANTGLAATAINFDPFVIVTPPSRLSATHTFGDAVKKTNSRLLDMIDRRLEAGKAAILGGAHA